MESPDFFFSLFQIYKSQFSQFEIAFLAFTRCLCVCSFTDRHAMLPQCANMYAISDRSNTKYNMKYIFLALAV